MKTNIKLLAFLATLAFLTITNIKQAPAQPMAVSFQVFYDELSPYGQWVDFPEYGYVWMPDAGPDFIPYATNGYWIMTDFGMTWVSKYRWGWAPFHYGRWNYDDYYGWFWVPDNEWGPAWVTWRYSSGYYGWMPMRPGISINISFESHYDQHYHHWIFVKERDIDRHDVHRYYINRRDHDRIIRSSVVINNTYVDNSTHVTYITGPDRNELHRNLGRNVSTASIHDNNRPGQDLQNDQLHLYRPQIAENDKRDRNIAPSRTTPLNDVKRISAGNSNNKERDRVQSDNSRQNRQQENENLRENKKSDANDIRRNNSTYSDNNREKNQQDKQNLQRKNNHKNSGRSENYRSEKHNNNSRTSGNIENKDKSRSSDRGRGGRK